MPLQGIDPGKLDRRITIQQRTVALDAYNEPVETWSALATVWAKVDYPLTASDENVTDGLNVAYTRIEFTIRHRTDIGFINRIVYGSDTYDVERISEEGRKSYLKITAERRK